MSPAIRDRNYSRRELLQPRTLNSEHQTPNPPTIAGELPKPLIPDLKPSHDRRYSRRELDNVLSVSGDELFNSTILMLKIFESHTRASLTKILESLERLQTQGAGGASEAAGGEQARAVPTQGGDKPPKLPPRPSLCASPGASQLPQALDTAGHSASDDKHLLQCVERLLSGMDHLSSKVDRQTEMLAEQAAELRVIKSSLSLRRGDHHNVEAAATCSASPSVAHAVVPAVSSVGDSERPGVPDAVNPLHDAVLEGSRDGWVRWRGTARRGLSGDATSVKIRTDAVGTTRQSTSAKPEGKLLNQVAGLSTRIEHVNGDDGPSADGQDNSSTNDGDAYTLHIVTSPPQISTPEMPSTATPRHDNSVAADHRRGNRTTDAENLIRDAVVSDTAGDHDASFAKAYLRSRRDLHAPAHMEPNHGALHHPSAPTDRAGAQGAGVPTLTMSRRRHEDSKSQRQVQFKPANGCLPSPTGLHRPIDAMDLDFRAR